MRMSVAQARTAFPKANIPKAKRQPRAKSKGEEMFWLQVCNAGYRLPTCVREFRFDNSRRWKMDFAWPELKVGVEIEGLRKSYIKGVPYALGRHCTFVGFEADCIKYANAALLGWHVLRFNQALVKNGTAIRLTRQLLVARASLTPYPVFRLDDISVVGAAPQPVRPPEVMTPDAMRRWLR
jgi:very-short-patch-repair endonuclease